MADSTVFNIDLLLQTTVGDRELAAQVVCVFLVDTPDQMAALKKALAENDAKTAERVAHSIKSSAASVGGEALRDIAFVCERLGHDGDLEAVKAKVEEMEKQAALLDQALRDNGFAEE